MESSKNQSVTLRIGGMTCINCQTKIEMRLSKLDGVLSAQVSWKKGEAKVDFDSEKISLEKIITEIEKLDCKVLTGREKSEQIFTAILYLVIIALLFMFLQKTGVMNALVPSSLASSKMSYALLFVTGLLTSVHCVAMCGGINLSQSLPSRGSGSKKLARADFLPSLLYNLGRVASYTLIGLCARHGGIFPRRGKRGRCVDSVFRARDFKNHRRSFHASDGILALGDFPVFARHYTASSCFSFKKNRFDSGQECRALHRGIFERIHAVRSLAGDVDCRARLCPSAFWCAFDAVAGLCARRLEFGEFSKCNGRRKIGRHAGNGAKIQPQSGIKVGKRKQH